MSVQQPLFTELFGAQYRYSGAGVGYQFASVVCGGFTPFIATALLDLNGSWHAVAAYLAGGCLVSVMVSARMNMPGDRVAVDAADSLAQVERRLSSTRS